MAASFDLDDEKLYSEMWIIWGISSDSKWRGGFPLYAYKMTY